MSVVVEAPGPSALQAAGGLALLLLLFVLREFLSGALREAGKEAWPALVRAARQRRQRRRSFEPGPVGGVEDRC